MTNSTAQDGAVQRGGHGIEGADLGVILDGTSEAGRTEGWARGDDIGPGQGDQQDHERSRGLNTGYCHSAHELALRLVEPHRTAVLHRSPGQKTRHAVGVEHPLFRQRDL